MKIVVLNGSPKGKLSISKKYVEFLQKKNGNTEFEYLDIGFNILKLEKNREYFDSVMKKIKDSDCVIWCTPVYYFMVPGQLKRFIELIYERNTQEVFKDKYAFSLTTSIHFYDTQTVEYLEAVSHDLDMNYFGDFTAHMNDFFKEKNRKELTGFFDTFKNSFENKIKFHKTSIVLNENKISYTPSKKDTEAVLNKNILIIADDLSQKDNLYNMIEKFETSIKNKITVLDLSQINIAGGCTGCLRCGYSNKCIYNDDVKKVYDDYIKKSDVILYALHIKDRYASSRFKYFQDRTFFNGHCPPFINKKIGYIFSGNYRYCPWIKQNLRAFCEYTESYLFGTISDECSSSEEIDILIDSLIKSMISATNNDCSKPVSFLGKSSHLIFRDFIYSHKSIFRADFKYYKNNKLFDFPHKDIKTRFFNFMMGMAFSIKKMREKIAPRFKNFMLKPYEKVMEKE